jgi:hypothetical protein
MGGQDNKEDKGELLIVNGIRRGEVSLPGHFPVVPEV